LQPLEMLGNGGWQRPLLGAVVNTGFDMLTLYFFFIAAGYPVGLGILVVGYGLPLLLGKIAFLLPGGIGVVESTMAALYTGLGSAQLNCGCCRAQLQGIFFLDSDADRISNSVLSAGGHEVREKFW